MPIPGTKENIVNENTYEIGPKAGVEHVVYTFDEAHTLAETIVARGENCRVRRTDKNGVFYDTYYLSHKIVAGAGEA